MIQARERDTVRVTKVKGHATDDDVEHGRVRLEGQLGNAESDAASDLGRRHQSELLMDAWRSLLKVRNHCYPTMMQLHRFMIAVARVAENHDGRGGTAPDPLVWDQGGGKKTRKKDARVNVDLASLPGPPGFLNGPWIQVHGGSITGADVAAWPQCWHLVQVYCLSWNFALAVDMGHFWVSYFEVHTLFGQWACHWLLSERLLGRMCELTVLLLFPLCLYKREMKLDTVVSSSVVWFGL